MRGSLAYSRAMLAFTPDGAPGDEDLMLAYAAGDASAFDALYERHRGGVYRYLVRHCGNAAAADEMFQDVWMSVIRVRATYAPSAKFTTWVYRIAHNRVVDHWRATGQVELVSAGGGQPGGGHSGGDPDDDDAPDPLAAIAGARGYEPEVRVAAKQLGARLYAALSLLPPAQRDAFLLHQEGGLSLSEIAALTGSGVETVKSRLRYALAKLRTELADLQ